MSFQTPGYPDPWEDPPKVKIHPMLLRLLQVRNIWWHAQVVLAVAHLQLAAFFARLCWTPANVALKGSIF